MERQPPNHDISNQDSYLINYKLTLNHTEIIMNYSVTNWEILNNTNIVQFRKKSSSDILPLIEIPMSIEFAFLSYVKFKAVNNLQRSVSGCLNYLKLFKFRSRRPYKLKTVTINNSIILSKLRVRYHLAS